MSKITREQIETNTGYATMTVERGYDKNGDHVTLTWYSHPFMDETFWKVKFETGSAEFKDLQSAIDEYNKHVV